MTIREYMNRKKLRFTIVAVACFGSFVAAVFLAAGLGGLNPMLAVALPGLAGFFACLIYAQTIAFRCPRCGGPWNVLVMQTGFFPFWIDHRIRFCPFCAADIDAKEGEKPRPDGTDLLD